VIEVPAGLDLQKLVKIACDQHGYKFFENGDYDLNVGGLRTGPHVTNRFDDLGWCIYRKGGVWQTHLWAMTTDPGAPYLEQPMREEGCAILVPDQYRGCWRLGTHRGKPGLVQIKPVKVYRDDDRDGMLNFDPATIQEGLFGINQHRAGANSTQVGKWSAGCQVTAADADFEEYLAMCRMQREQRGWESFSYTLFDVRQTPALSALLHLAAS